MKIRDALIKSEELLNANETTVDGNIQGTALLADVVKLIKDGYTLDSDFEVAKQQLKNKR